MNENQNLKADGKSRKAKQSSVVAGIDGFLSLVRDMRLYQTAIASGKLNEGQLPHAVKNCRIAEKQVDDWIDLYEEEKQKWQDWSEMKPKSGQEIAYETLKGL